MVSAAALAVVGAAALALAWLLFVQGAPSSRAHARGGSDAAPRGWDAVPAAARGVVSRTLGSEDRRLFARSAAGGFAVANRGAGVEARFSRGGAVVRAGGASWSLGLRAYGHGGRVTAVGRRAPDATRNRVVYRRAGVQESYANGPLGVEQRFTLPAPPSGSGGGPLTLAVGRLPEGARARVAAGGRDVLLARAGRDLLRYRGLSASDARGRGLPARIEPSGGQLVLRVDDRGARYPVRVSSFVQAAKLTASDGAAGDQLGWFVAVSRDGATVVAGAPTARVGENAAQGAVYVFAKPRRGWATATETAKLTASDGGAGDNLGFAVGISDDGATIVAGAPGARIGDNRHQGAAYVFVERRGKRRGGKFRPGKPRGGKPRGGWVTGTETAKLTASDGAAGDGLGFGGAISGDGATVIAGAPDGSAGAGAGYVFVKPRRGWATATETAKLTASDGVPYEGLGIGVTISRDGATAVAGAPGARIGANPLQGATYVFVRPSGGWASGTEAAKLTASDGGAGDALGTGVGISADGATVVAGAFGNKGVRGAAYVYVRPGGGWASATETAGLTASDGVPGDFMGITVAVSGDGATIAVGAPGDEAARGATYVYDKPRDGWATATETAKLTASAGLPGDSVGAVVAFSGDGTTIATGAVTATIGANAGQGAAYVFVSGRKASRRSPRSAGHGLR